MNEGSRHGEAHDAELQRQVRAAFGAHEPSHAPSFDATLQRARQRLSRPRAKLALYGWRLAPWGAAVAAGALLALVIWPRPEPSLADDLTLAQSVSFEAVWSAPSDRLPGAISSTLLRGGPALPRIGSPDFSSEFPTDSAEEYL